MSDTTGIAPGFAGFAVTPAGQAQYLARKFNPYGFLQQPVSTDTAPGASDAMMARGGDVKRRRRKRWQRLDDGGDADGSDGAAGGTNGGFGGADAPGNDPGGPSALGGGIAPDANATLAGLAAFGQNAPQGSITPDANSTLAGLAGNSLGTMGGMTSAGQPSGLGFPAFAVADPEPLSLGQLGVAAAKGVAGPLGSLVGAAGKAAGVDPLGHGAATGAQLGSTLGGMFGGPLGGAAGAVVGAVAGAHGTSGPGMGGTNSNAGPGGVQDGDRGDIASLIQRIHGAMTQQSPTATGLGAFQDRSPLTQGLAGGGLAGIPGQPSAPQPNHNFHAGSGLVHGSSDGRADALHMQVPHGGYVVPADVVSGLGQGNTMAGAKKLRGMMPSRAPGLASGGRVPVRLSAGEFFIHPSHVAALGGGNLKAGSDKLDTMVGHVRRISASQVSRMPGPR